MKTMQKMKILILLFSLCFMFGCVNNTQNIQNKFNEAGYKLTISDRFDGLQVLDLSSKKTSFLITSVDDKIEFISYHEEDIYTYITYLQTKKSYIGEAYYDENHTCSYDFTNTIDGIDEQCNKTKEDALKVLRSNMEKELTKLNINIDDLIAYADDKLNH